MINNSPCRRRLPSRIDTRRCPNVTLMLAQSLRRWPNIKTISGQRLASAVIYITRNFPVYMGHASAGQLCSVQRHTAVTYYLQSEQLLLLAFAKTKVSFHFKCKQLLRFGFAERTPFVKSWSNTVDHRITQAGPD